MFYTVMNLIKQETKSKIPHLSNKKNKEKKMKRKTYYKDYYGPARIETNPFYLKVQAHAACQSLVF